MNKTEIEKVTRNNCQICNFDRYVERCHIIPKSLGGGNTSLNILYLCPNHHKLLDYGLLNKEELVYIEHFLIALVEHYKDDKDKINYLYFQLRLKDNVPIFIGNNRRKLLKKKPSNAFF